MTAQAPTGSRGCCTRSRPRRASMARTPDRAAVRPATGTQSTNPQRSSPAATLVAQPRGEVALPDPASGSEATDARHCDEDRDLRSEHGGSGCDPKEILHGGSGNAGAHAQLVELAVPCRDPDAPTDQVAQRAGTLDGDDRAVNDYSFGWGERLRNGQVVRHHRRQLSDALVALWAEHDHAPAEQAVAHLGKALPDVVVPAHRPR